jgi:pimeloyl-ACP methyl ester carboxylesterase
MICRHCFLSLILCLVIPVLLSAQESKPLQNLDEKIPIKTTGGILFWGDVLFFHDWHIQQNVKNDSYRLLDGNSIQRAYGSFDDCKKRLNEIQVEEGILPMSGTAVIILHGFGSNAMTTRHLAGWLREKKAYDYVFNMAYPSTMQSIFDHTKMLDRVVKNLPPTIKQIDFVGHSLGSIIIRRYLSGPLDPDWKVPDDRLAARKKFSPDKRVGKFVMLGPPNHGAVIAAKMIGNDPVRRFFSGKSGDELGIDWNKTEQTLGIPCCPFAIISGGRGDDRGFSLLIPGDDDGIVSVEGTQLEGTEEWTQFYVGHGEMLLTKEVFEAVLKFLQDKR